jgi:hypothetical protein
VPSIKNRQKFIADLHSGLFFLQGVLERVSGIEEQVIRHALIRQGITTSACYVISENTALHTHTLHEAQRTVVGWGAGTILVFGDADLIFSSAWWLTKTIHQQAHPTGTMIRAAYHLF